ncbi:hypothetical protein MHU86_8257 [Fragilaria crotonensis]|nr:hypothetical protein MHU86_8257 [Fragilaria crotonensis]
MAAAARLDAAATPREQATAHLIVMAFYFLLRVGEYTLPPAHVTTRTIQFRVSDTRFWQGQTLLPPTSEAATLAAATSVTLVMDNQKNGHRGDTIHQEACDTDFCPVRSVAALVSAIMAQNMPVSTPLSFVQPGMHVQPGHILHAVRRGAQLAQLEASGYQLTRIGAHRCAPRVPWLVVIRSWPGSDYETGTLAHPNISYYIHSQIAALTTGTSRKMGRSVNFHNVGG